MGQPALPQHHTAETHLSREEVERSLASLAVVDLIRLEKFARARAGGLSSVGWEDLLQEAIARAISGRRAWPRGVECVVFLSQTMRSIAFEERRKDGEQPRLSLDAVPVVYVPSDAPDVERAVHARRQVEELLELFSEDAEVLHLIEGLKEGETAVETQKRAGLSAAAYDAARKRFRRAMDVWLSGASR